MKVNKARPIFFRDPAILESICYRTREKRLINESNTTGGRRKIWTGIAIQKPDKIQKTVKYKSNTTGGLRKIWTCGWAQTELEVVGLFASQREESLRTFLVLWCNVSQLFYGTHNTNKVLLSSFCGCPFNSGGQTSIVFLCMQELCIECMQLVRVRQSQFDQVRIPDQIRTILTQTSDSTYVNVRICSQRILPLFAR